MVSPDGSAAHLHLASFHGALQRDDFSVGKDQHWWIPDLIKLLRSVATAETPEMQADVVGAIANRAGRPEYQETIVRAGGVELLTKVLASGSANGR